MPLFCLKDHHCSIIPHDKVILMNREQIHHIEGNLSSRKKQYNYPGQLKIDGDIEAGCQVSAESIDANNITQANVRARSDIFVREQITDSTIVTPGKIKSNVIVHSTIRAEQDIIVLQKIDHSTIQTNGSCLISEGHIESSDISAYQSIDADIITGESESASTLTIGLLCPDDQDITIKNKYLQLENQKKLLHNNLQSAEKIIRDVLKLKQKMNDSEPALKQKIRHLKETKQRYKLDELKPFFQELNHRMMVAYENLKKALSEKDRLLKAIESFDQKLLDETKKDYLNRKKERIFQSIQNQSNEKPYIIVRNLLGKNTYIIGLHCQKRLHEDLENVKIQEIQKNGTDQDSILKTYDIEIMQLKADQ
jgi:hypothetical protein